jgi:COMM domain containing 9
MDVPSVMLQLGIAEEQAQAETMSKTRKVNIELTKESLDTMLEGLGRIRDQLSTMK